jgi:hypothetical protein
MNAMFQDLPQGRLLAAPVSSPGESLASWVQQVCGAHQYSFQRLTDISRIRPVGSDWDAGVTSSEWARLEAMADLPDVCAEALFSFNVLEGMLPRQRHLLYESAKPRSRWCAICLSTDRIPYLRWEWRLAAVMRCSIHDVTLDEKCPWCNGFLNLHRALLVGGGAAAGVPDLSICGHCGMSLLDMGFKAPEDSPTDSSHQLMKELLDGLRQAYQSDTKQLTLDFNRYREIVAPPTQWRSKSKVGWFSAPMWVDMRIRRLPVPENPSFTLGKVNFAEVPAQKPREPVPRWDDNLRAADRSLLARALQIIRFEKKFPGKAPINSLEESGKR